MTQQHRRLAGWSLVVGGALGIAGYVAAGVATGGGDDRFTHALWQPLYALALAGGILLVLGMPAILDGMEGHSPRLTLVGYVGLFAALVMLNLGEGVIEGFVKPYLATHGGIPADDPTGLAVYETVGLVGVLFGLVSLGIAVLRAGVFPRWVGVLLIAAPFVSFAVGGLPMPLEELGDVFAYAALAGIGRQVAMPARGLAPALV